MHVGILLPLALLLSASLALAQMEIEPGKFTAPNEPTTGTKDGLNMLARLTPAGAKSATKADTALPLWVVVGGAGTTGSAILQTSGLVDCIFDDVQANTAGFFVVNSTKVDRLCHAVDSRTPPTSGYVVGVLVANTTAPGAKATMVPLSVNYSPGSGAPVVDVAAKRRVCTHVLRDGDDLAALCGNEFASDWKLLSVSCYSKGAPLAVNVTLTGGTPTSVLTAPLQCGNEEWVSGEVNGTPIVHSFSGKGALCVTKPCDLRVKIQARPDVGQGFEPVVIRITGVLP
jgi:hypothetical protein